MLLKNTSCKTERKKKMTEYIQTDKKAPLKAEVKGEIKTDITELATPEITPSSEAPPVKEVKFFSDPKVVKKKTQSSIVTFQLVFTAIFCLIYKLTALFAPELYLNVSTYLERLFGW